ncbi:hypothetical protein Pcac1_g1409 [Phytophthora cactorum]|nr:hypothetical protein Pcac1_g1409 [Phytophthora cactorum]
MLASVSAILLNFLQMVVPFGDFEKVDEPPALPEQPDEVLVRALCC